MSAKSNRGRGRDAPQRHPSATLPDRLLPDRLAHGSSGQARADPLPGIPSPAPVNSLLPERGTPESRSGQAREVGRNALLPSPARRPSVSGALESTVQVGGARENTSANPAGKHISARSAGGSSGRLPWGLPASKDVMAEGNACSSAASMGQNTELIQRVANNIATPADMDSLNQKLLDHDTAIYRELQQRQSEYRKEGRVLQADRLRSIIAQVLLHSRSHPKGFSEEEEEEGTGDDREALEEAKAKKVAAATALAQTVAETIERIAHGTASKAQKKEFTYDLLVSEGLFDRVSKLQSIFSESDAKGDQVKAKRLARVLNECDQSLLTIHKDAAVGGDLHMNPVFLGSSVSARGGAGTSSTSRGSAAGASEQIEEEPARGEASAPRQTSIPRRRAPTPAAQQIEAASQSSEGPTVREVRRQASARTAAGAQRVTAEITATLEQTRLNEAQQRVQEGSRSGGSRGQAKVSSSTNPKKAKKGRSRK